MRQKGRQGGFISVFVIIVVIFLAIGGMYYYNSQKKSPLGLIAIPSSPTIADVKQTSASKETKTIYLDSKTNKFIGGDAGYSFEYQYNYYLNYNPATKGFVMGEGASPYFYTESLPEDLYGGFGMDADNEGTVYSREFITPKGLKVKQIVTIKSIDHPQGLGSVNTTLTNPKDSLKKAFLVDFIQNRLTEIQKEKSLKDLTEGDYVKLLEDLKVNNQIINSFEFL